MLQYDYQS